MVVGGGGSQIPLFLVYHVGVQSGHLDTLQQDLLKGEHFAEHSDLGSWSFLSLYIL